MIRRTLGLAAVAASLTFTATMRPVAAKEDTAPRERTFAFAYSATVKDVPVGAKTDDLWLPVPHDTPYQRISDLRIESPVQYSLDTAEYGNTVLHLEVDAPVTAPLTVTVRFDAVRTEHTQERLYKPIATPAPDPADRDMARWLLPDRLVPIDGKVSQWAHDVVRKSRAVTDLDRARAIYNHVVSTVKYDKSGVGWGRGDIYYACDARRGNCTDFHAIFIGYCRALGIPARFAIGFPLPADRGAGQIAGYHCWAEFYARGIGWVPVDASEAAKNPDKREYYFGHHDENRVEFTVGRDLTLAPKQHGDPLNYFVYPYAEVDGMPFASVDRAFSYRDLTSTKAE